MLQKFWSQQAQDIYDQIMTFLSSSMQGNQDGIKVIMKSTYMLASRDKVKQLTPTRCLHSTNLSQVKLYMEANARADRIEPQGSIVRGLDERFYIKDFQQLLSKVAPYICSMEGCFREVQEVRESQQGVPTIDFKFCDAHGHYIYGIGHGEVAENALIENDKQVVLFFGKIQAGPNDGAPKLWLYSDSIIFPKASSSVMPPERNAIAVRTE